MKYNPMLACDYYKTIHADLLPKGITKSVSYYTPRSSRIPGWDHAVFFGLKGFIQEYLVEMFNENFFDRPKKAVLGEIEQTLDKTLNCPLENTIYRHAVELYDLGYLPIEIFALPEGSHVPMGVPMFAISNTHPDFAWLPQYLESLLSSEMWHGIIVATVADKYKEIVNKHYAISVGENRHVRPEFAMSSFDMRGEESFSDAVKAGAAWATSFVPCATVATSSYLDRYYAGGGCAISGSPSTEHAVMCSNAAVDGNEEDFIKRMLKEYALWNFSIVLDSYDYWHVVKEVLPKLKKDILAHKGCMLIRGDSGDAVEVATETVFALWDIFGGEVNAKGYKVLDPHVKAIYGDGITLDRCERIYSILEENGFAASNVVLGVGSYSMQAVTIDGERYPFTRDTFNIAIKATYIEVNRKSYQIHKSPKVDGAHGETKEYFKKSNKGCVLVFGKDGEYVTKDKQNYREAHDAEMGELRLVFRDGKFAHPERDNLSEIRKRLDGYRRAHDSV